MRIECPGCEAAYEVPESQIRPGRSVRCARCNLEWRPAGELPPQSDPVPAELGGATLRQHGAPAPSIVPETAVARPGRRIGGSSLGWAASVVILIGLLGSAVHWRQAVMHGWPPSMRLYAVFGAQPAG